MQVPNSTPWQETSAASMGSNWASPPSTSWNHLSNIYYRGEQDQFWKKTEAGPAQSVMINTTLIIDGKKEFNVNVTVSKKELEKKWQAPLVEILRLGHQQLQHLQPERYEPLSTPEKSQMPFYGTAARMSNNYRGRYRSGGPQMRRSGWRY